MKNAIEKKSPDFATKVLLLLLFATGGGFLWGLRGAAGYGGTSGAVLPGLWWGLCWHALSAGRRNGAGWLVLACAFGYGFGGMHGYGQFMSWDRGIFRVDNSNGLTESISPAIGFLWWTITGFGWGGFGGILLSGALDRTSSRGVWAARGALLIGGWIGGAWFVQTFPQLVYPNYPPGGYDLSVCTDCKRTLRTLPTQGSFIAMLLFSLAFEAARGKWANVRNIALSAAGFGAAFLIANWNDAHYSQIWKHMDSWKVCEMSVGFIGGLAVGAIFLLDRAGSKEWTGRVEHASLSERICGTNLAIMLVLAWGGVQCSNVVGFHYLGMEENSPIQFTLGLPAAVAPALLIFAVSAWKLAGIRRKDGALAPDPKPWLKLRLSLGVLLAYGIIVTVKENPLTTACFIVLSAAALCLSMPLQRRKEAQSAV